MTCSTGFIPIASGDFRDIARPKAESSYSDALPATRIILRATF